MATEILQGVPPLLKVCTYPLTEDNNLILQGVHPLLNVCTFPLPEDNNWDFRKVYSFIYKKQI